MFVAISAAGAFRTDDGGKTWKAINRGLKSEYIPDPNAEVGFCVHRIAMHKARPGTLFMQLHQGGGAFRTDNAGDQWTEVKGNLPTDFGFPIDIHAHEPNTVYLVPMDPNIRVPPEGKLRVWRSRAGGNEWEPLSKGLPQKDCFVNVLRDAMAVDSLDPCGIYFGAVRRGADAGVIEDFHRGSSSRVVKPRDTSSPDRIGKWTAACPMLAVRVVGRCKVTAVFFEKRRSRPRR